MFTSHRNTAVNSWVLHLFNSKCFETLFYSLCRSSPANKFQKREKEKVIWMYNDKPAKNPLLWREVQPGPTGKNCRNQHCIYIANLFFRQSSKFLSDECRHLKKNTVCACVLLKGTVLWDFRLLIFHFQNSSPPGSEAVLKSDFFKRKFSELPLTIH
jgi:hypothetical protein